MSFHLISCHLTSCYTSHLISFHYHFILSSFHLIFISFHSHFIACHVCVLSFHFISIQFNFSSFSGSFVHLPTCKYEYVRPVPYLKMSSRNNHRIGLSEGIISRSLDPCRVKKSCLISLVLEAIPCMKGHTFLLLSNIWRFPYPRLVTPIEGSPKDKVVNLIGVEPGFHSTNRFGL